MKNLRDQTSYPGGKGGCYQRIISLIPPHSTYIEPFVGGGAIVRKKLPSDRTIILDLDANALNRVSKSLAFPVEAIHGCALNFLSNYNFRGDEVIYCDPPYLPSTRKKSKIYKYEFDVEHHKALLVLLKRLDANVILSGYWSELYEKELADWTLVQFTVQTHHGSAIESIWMNYPTPHELHDYRFIGNTFGERQRIKRKLARWKSRYDTLSPMERAYFYQLIQETHTAHCSSYTLKQAASITGLTISTVDRLEREGVVRASANMRRGKGIQRKFTFNDLVELKVWAHLINQGVSIVKIKEAARDIRAFLEGKNIGRYARESILVDGQKLLVSDDEKEFLLEVGTNGQLSLPILMDREAIKQDIEQQICLHIRPKKIMRGSSYRQPNEDVING